MSAALVYAASGGFFHSALAAGLASLVGGLLVGLAVLALVNPHRDVGSRIGRFINPAADDLSPQASLIERALGNNDDVQLQRVPFLQRLAVDVDVAGLNFSVQQIILVALLAAIVIGWLLDAQTGSPIAGALGLLMLPLAYYGVGFAAGRQRKAFDDQLPDNLQVIASAMRAGQPFVGALATVADDAPEPSRRELKRAVTDERIGVPLDEALGRVTERMKSEEFAHVAMVATLQRETGGNTAEVIDLVTETVRERLEIRRMVSTLTAQGRLAGVILSGLPVALLMGISAINPGYVHPLFHKTIGIIALSVSGVMVLLGGLAIKKIFTIDV